MRPVLVVPPSSSPVLLSRLKAHGRITFEDDDVLLQSYLDAAVSYLDGYGGVLGRCLITQTWRQDFEDWESRMRLPFPDVSAATISYTSTDGTTQAIDAADFQIVRGDAAAEIWFRSGFSLPGLQDSAAPISVQMQAGYGNAADVPPAIGVAIMMLALHWYEHGTPVGSGSEMPFSVSALIAPYRMIAP